MWAMLSSLSAEPQPEAIIPPSFNVRSGSKISSGETFIMLPMPEQQGQAPNGLLNENIRGESSSMLMPQSSQA